MYVKKNEGKAHGQSDPENDKAKNEADKGRYRCEVAERFGAQKPRKGILFHGSEAVFLLCMEHVRNLCQDAELLLSLGFVLAGEREAMYPQGRRQVDLVTGVGVRRITCRGEIAVEYPLCGGNEVETRDCC